MSFFLGFVWGAVVVYSAVCWVLFTGLKKATRPVVQKIQNPAPGPVSLSVVVCARNEEAGLGQTLEALAEQRFLPEAFEVVVVDDRSTDHTGEIAQSFSRQFRHFCLIQVSEDPGDLFGKQNAIDVGVSAARGDFILLTDADCAPHPDFCQTLYNAFLDGADFVFSRTVCEKGRGALKHLQTLDLSFLFMVAGGTAGLGIPLSCMGNNMGFRKTAYQEIGGYPKIGPSKVEDCQLLNCFREKGYSIQFVSARDPLVTTRAKKSFRGFLQQRARWAQGIWSFSPTLFTLSGIAGVTNGLLLTSLFAPLGPVGSGIPVLAKIGVDAVFLRAGSGLFRIPGWWKGFLVWEGYSLLSPLLVLGTWIKNRRQTW